MLNRAQPVPLWSAWSRQSLRYLCLGFLAVATLQIGLPVQSGEPVPPIREPSKEAVATAAAAAAMRSPAGVLGIIQAGETLSVWEPPATRKVASPMDQAPAIDPDLLAGIEDKAEMRNAAENYNEAWAYSYLLVQANATSAEALAKSARKDLTFAHLFEEPSKYRGQVVHIEGRLKRLRRFDAPRLAAKQGVPVIYEGWIFGDAYGSNPYCVIATALPNSTPLGETVEQRVSFDGYFFKRYRYKAGDGWRDAPLLIGHSLSERESPNATSESDVGYLLPLLIAVVVGTVLLVIGLNWWFRRGDRQLRAHLDQARKINFVEPKHPFSGAP
jgi:hypothetical protein